MISSAQETVERKCPSSNPTSFFDPVHQNTQAVNRLAEIVLPRGLQFVVDCLTLLSLQVSASNFPGRPLDLRTADASLQQPFQIPVDHGRKAAQFLTDRLGFTNDCLQDPVSGRFAYTKQ